ncbi:MAG: VOC family protein [Nitratireductor sp.]|nr:VOC family protein [Nitratireductor sp.]
MDTQALEAKFKPPVNAAVWFEIPVSDLAKAKTFYSKVLMTEFVDQNDGPNPMAIFAYSGTENGVSGHLYPGRPAAHGTGPTVHLPVPDSVEEGLARVTACGGKVLSPVIEIPAGRFAYCLDPDGNSIGIFSN